ncbi:unnamed protein product, partial [Brachionus calyciflorus]
MKELETEDILNYKSENHITIRRPVNVIQDQLFTPWPILYVFDRYLTLIGNLFEFNQDQKTSVKINTISDEPSEFEEYFKKAFENFENQTKNGIEPSQSDIIRLKPGQWLNDNIINCSFNLLKIEQIGVYSVKNWLRKENIFQYELVLMPINKNNNHWILCL